MVPVSCIGELIPPFGLLFSREIIGLGDTDALLRRTVCSGFGVCGVVSSDILVTRDIGGWISDVYSQHLFSFWGPLSAADTYQKWNRCRLAMQCRTASGGAVQLMGQKRWTPGGFRNEGYSM